jgi:hypothetical protein
MFRHRINYWKAFALLAAAIVPAGAQVMERRAAIGGGQPNGPGKCTIEVVVDVAAEIQISGDRAVMRTLGGQPSQWRRFECSSALPAHPFGFRFAGVDGRGNQQLIADPGRTGTAVVRIDDPRSGAEGYTFDIFWNGAEGFAPPPPPIEPRREGFDRDRDRGDDRRFDNRTSIRPYEAQEAVKACEDAAIQQASERFRTRDVVIRRSAIDDAPGRNDWVVGMMEVRRGRDADPFRFSCSVDFRGRSLRSVSVDPIDRRR